MVVSMPFSGPLLYINDPPSLEFVLSTKFDSYVKKGLITEALGDVLGHGILVSDGHQWYKQRKLGVKVFTAKSFKYLLDNVLSAYIHVLLSVLEKASEQNDVVDVQQFLQQFFFDSFCEMGFGVKISTLSGDSSDFSDAFDRSQLHCQNRAFNPLWKLYESSQVKKDFETVRNATRNLLNKSRREEKIKKPFPDLSDLFLEYRDENGNALTEEELIDQVLTFLIAGRDTTSQTLSWTLYCLAKNPRVVKKLLEEANAIMGNAKTPTYEQTKQMKYALAVFQETLRLHAPISRNCKVAANDETLPNGIFVPKGTVVCWSVCAMGRNPKLWDHPEEFLPERWLNGKPPSAFANPVFHAGPRTCIGKSMAEIQGVFVLVSLIKNYDIQVQNVENVTYLPSLTMPVKDGLMCRIEKRNAANQNSEKRML
jgi:cytochrome P450